MKTYFNLQDVPRFLSLDNIGVLRKDATPGGALATISSGILSGAFCKSDSLFAREYLAFSDGKNGLDIPRQFDDTNFDRVSQVGPGKAPIVADQVATINVSSATQEGTANINEIFELVPNLDSIITASQLHTAPGTTITIAGVAAAGYNGTFLRTGAYTAGTAFLETVFNYPNPTTPLPVEGVGGTLASSYVTIQTATPHGLGVGQSVIVAGVGAGYNGTWLVEAVPDTTHFTFFATTTGLAALGAGGTIQLSGSIAAGKHGCSVIFVTRNGYYTKPSPPSYWTAAGGKRAVVANIPIGPPNVIARILCFTAVNQASFYHLGPLGLTLAGSNMYIADNTTTSLTVDFTDQLLLLGTLDDPLFNQIELPPVAGTIGYSSRLLHWGEQSNVQEFQNLSFDGGFSNLTSATTGTSPNFPLGWTPDATNSAGGGSANVGAQPAIFGDAYTITGDGVTAVRGKIAQNAATNYLGNPILLPNTAYGVQARLRMGGARALAGTVHINLQSTSGGYTTAGWSVAFGSAGQIYTLDAQTLTAGLATIPADLVLQVYVDGTPTNDAVFILDNIEIYPLNQQFNNSNVRASKAVGDLPDESQESYDGVTGLIQYNLNDGQSVRSMFKIRKQLYIVKEHSFGVTEDDGVNEPALWAVNDVSKAVGTPSINGVGLGEDWVVIAHRTGLYLFWGGEVLKISEEIQPTWDSINWEYGYTLSVSVDLRHRRILICAPFGNSTVPNKTLVLDYHDVGSDAAAISSNAPIHLTYAGVKKAFDRARKWALWTVAANSVAQIELSNGQTGTYFGSNDGTGTINVLDETGTVFTDNGATIPSYYVTAAFCELPTEEAKNLKSHRHLYTYLAMYVQGSGTLGITVFPDSLSNAIALNSQTLSNPAFQDLQMYLNQSTERMFVKVASQGTGQWFDLQRMVVNVKPEPWAIIR